MVKTGYKQTEVGVIPEDWKLLLFGKVAKVYRGGSPRPIQSYITNSSNGVNWIKIGDVRENDKYIYSTQEKIRPDGISMSREVHIGDFILSNSMSFGRPYILRTNGCIHDGWLTIQEYGQAFSTEYLYYLLSSKIIYKQYIGMAAGSSVKNLNKDKVSSLMVICPPLPEQQRIAEALSDVDGMISSLEKLIAKYKSIKTACLQQMFPQNGETVPRMRFPGFTGAWEQRKFDEVFDCTVPNNTLSRAELSYDEGTVLNVHYGDVLIKYGSVLDVQKDDIPRIPHRCREDFNGALLQDGDVIIADTAEDETTGKACEIGNLQGSAIVSGLHTMVCRPRNRMALGYLGYYLNSNAYHHQLLPLMQGIKVLSLSRSNIQKTSVNYPIAVKEQQLIAYYFSQLDNLITLHQRKLEKVQKIKQGMMQQLLTGKIRLL